MRHRPLLGDVALEGEKDAEAASSPLSGCGPKDPPTVPVRLLDSIIHQYCDSCNEVVYALRAFVWLGDGRRLFF